MHFRCALRTWMGMALRDRPFVSQVYFTIEKDNGVHVAEVGRGESVSLCTLLVCNSEHIVGQRQILN